MPAVLKKLTSLLLMLTFTITGFLVLAASVLVMTVESLITVISPIVGKKASLREPLIKGKAPSREAQIYLKL